MTSTKRISSARNYEIRNLKRESCCQYPIRKNSFRIHSIVMHHRPVRSMCLHWGRHCSGCARLAHDALTCLYLIVPLLSVAWAIATPAAPPSIYLLHASIIPATKQAKLNLIAYEIYFKLLANCLECVLLLDTECLPIIYDNF